MTELEGPSELKTIAENAHMFMKGFMSLKNIPQPPVMFLVAESILMPDPADSDNMRRVMRRFLEMTGVCYAYCFIARLRNEDGEIVHEDSLMVIASDSGDLTYNISLPFTIERREEQVVGILWEEDSLQSGFQSRSENKAHVQTLTPRQQRLLDYVRSENDMDDQPLDLLRLLGMRVIPCPIEEPPTDE